MDGELQKVKERSPAELNLGPGKHNQKGKPLEAMVINIMTRIHYNSCYITIERVYKCNEAGLFRDIRKQPL